MLLSHSCFSCSFYVTMFVCSWGTYMKLLRELGPVLMKGLFSTFCEF